MGRDAFFVPFREDDVLASDHLWAQPSLPGGLPWCWLRWQTHSSRCGEASLPRRNNPTLSSGFSRLQNTCDDKQIKKYCMQKREGFVSACLFAPLS